MAAKDYSKEPSMTIAMGMKMNIVAAECWRMSCLKEERIRDEWKRKYQPQLEAKEDEIVRRYLESEEQKKKLPRPPEFALLSEGVSKDGKGRKAYLKARLATQLQDRQAQPMTISQTVGWRCLSIPPPRDDALPSFGRKPVIKNGFYRRSLGGSLV